MTTPSTSRRPLLRRALVAALGIPALVAGVLAAQPAQALPGDLGTSSLYVKVDPIRVAQVPLGPGGSTQIDMGNTVSPVPANATAVAMNVTVAGISRQTYVSVCPGGTAVTDCSRVSTLNPYAGRDVANFAIVSLGPSPAGGNDGLRLYNNLGNVTVLVDLVGYFVAAASAPAAATDFSPRAPYRDLDSPLTLTQAQFRTVTIDSVPAGATAVAVRATAAGNDRNTYISLCPPQQGNDLCNDSSTLNPAAGRDTSNMTIVPLGGAGTSQIKVYNNLGSTLLYLDILGFMVPQGQGALFTPVETYRTVENLELDDTTFFADLFDPAAPARTVGYFANVTTAGNTVRQYLSTCLVSDSVDECLSSSTVNSYAGQDTAAGAIIATTDGINGPEMTYMNSDGRTLVNEDLSGYFVTRP